jgi:crotonobetainyl-CoA:carnitine CoA-transferase CaiB-like acyl-CoA transferase
VIAPVLEGLTVLDLTSGSAGPVATMLLADHGADVIKIERPGGDPFRRAPAYTVWNRSKRSVVLDLRDDHDRAAFHELAARAHVLIDSFPPATAAALGLDHDALHAANPGLVSCSITPYGREGEWSDRPGWDALVQARTGMQWEQYGLRPGPIFLHAPLPSMGAALLAVTGITAALLVRERTGRGQHVDTSLMQGALLWMTQMWTRAETPTPELELLWMFREPGPTPCFEAGDGVWFHPMPQGISVALEHLGRSATEMTFAGAFTDRLEARLEYQAQLRAVFKERPAQEWIDLLQGADVSCQPILAAEESFTHFQVLNNRAATTVEFPGLGPVQQVGHLVHLERHDEPAPRPPVPAGHDTEAVLAELATPAAARPGAGGARNDTPLPAHPLAGIRVLDFGTALAGPFANMILADLGADVIKVDNLAMGPGTPADATYAACHRGKRSIAVDLKHPEGREIAHALIRTADVVHYNLRTGVAERLGFDYEQVRALNPRVVFCHVTAYGNTGPFARWPGVDQMGQALSGLEYEQGGTRAGGHPNWYRYGMCDATTSMLSVIGVLEALRARERTGLGQAVETNILNAGMLLSSDAFVGPESLGTRPILDAAQTGLGPRYRLYETGHEWLCVAAVADAQWRTLCEALGVAVDASVETVEGAFRAKSADEWFALLDARGVPCEVSRETTGYTWYDDPEVRARGWVVDYPHPVWGRMQQPGHFLDFSLTPDHVEQAPPLIGAHTVELLEELGYPRDRIDELRARGTIGW